MLIFLIFSALWDRILCSGFFFCELFLPQRWMLGLDFFSPKLNLFQFLCYHLQSFSPVLSQSPLVLSSFTSFLRRDPCTCRGAPSVEQNHEEGVLRAWTNQVSHIQGRASEALWLPSIGAGPWQKQMRSPRRWLCGFVCLLCNHEDLSSNPQA